MVLSCDNFFLLAVTTVEFINTSARLDLLLFAGVEGMALRANVEFDNVALLGGAGYEGCAASANRGCLMIIGMYILFHVRISPQKMTCTSYYNSFDILCQSFSRRKCEILTFAMIFVRLIWV